VLFAAYMDNGYKVILLLHLLAIVVGFAPAWLTPVLVRLTAGGERAAADALDASILRYSLPGLGVAGLLGFGLAGMSKIEGFEEPLYKMSQTWLVIAIVLWLVLLAVTFFVARPAIKAFRDGDVAARGRVAMSTGIAHLILVVMLYLMIFKPGA
jgi:uncharacterized membrane protein